MQTQNVTEKTQIAKSAEHSTTFSIVINAECIDWGINKVSICAMLSIQALIFVSICR